MLLVHYACYDTTTNVLDAIRPTVKLRRVSRVILEYLKFPERPASIWTSTITHPLVQNIGL